MITDRDKNIISFIEDMGYATITNIAEMFFNNSKYSYDLARKRLLKLYKSNNLKKIHNFDTNEVVYLPYDSKRKSVSFHDIKLINYITKLNMLGCKINKVLIEPIFNNIKPDALISFELKGYMYYQLIEVQLRHAGVDLNRFKNNDTINSILKESDNVAPKLIIIQNTNRDYEKENDTIFPITKINTDMDNILDVFF